MARGGGSQRKDPRSLIPYRKSTGRMPHVTRRGECFTAQRVTLLIECRRKFLVRHYEELYLGPWAIAPYSRLLPASRYTDHLIALARYVCQDPYS